jgi:hypothetical protein
VPGGDEVDGRLASGIVVVMCAALALAAADGAAASSRPRPASHHSRISAPPERRVFLLGLRQRGNPAAFASMVSNPSSRLYRHFLALREFRQRFSTAYAVDPLHARGLEGAGVRVATLSSQEVDASGFRTWARCSGLRAPVVRQVAMPGVTSDTGTAPEKTVLDVEALASLAPGLQQITPIFVPLDQSFSNSFVLFMFGAIDPSRHGGRLPDILSISDGSARAASRAISCSSESGF